MPIYLTQWRDGDFSVTAADSLEQAHTHFYKIACLDLEDIRQLEAPDLTVTLSLDQKGNSTFTHYEGAVEEARRVCYPRLVEALGGMSPDHITGTARVAEIDRIVDDETRLRRRSKLSKHLARRVPPAPASRART